VTTASSKLDTARRSYQMKENTSMPIDKELLAILACPKCKGDIRLAKDGNGLVCEPCRLLYEIRDNIPVMLIDEAIRLDDPTRV
jgi:uncharacterized protein YbaR (Trm112 family)